MIRPSGDPDGLFAGDVCPNEVGLELSVGR